MKKRQMYFRMITASLLRRRSRMVIALLAIAIGATILSGLVTIYVDVPRQMQAQFRNYGANMILTGIDEKMTQEDLDNATALVPGGQLVGVAPYRYETVRINDRPVMAAATDMAGAQKTSPFWAVDGEWPAAQREIMIGKSVAETYNLKIGKRVTCTYAPDTGDKAAQAESAAAEETEAVPAEAETAGQDALAAESSLAEATESELAAVTESGLAASTESGLAAATESSVAAESELIAAGAVDEEDVVLDNYIDFTVTAILDTGGKEEDYVYMVPEDLEELTGKPTVYDVCELSVSASSAELKGIAEDINTTYDTMKARLVKRVTESETTVLTKLQSLVLLVTIVVLGLTMICVATTMTAVVAERRKEIGLRKALGASNKSIIMEFMGEGLVLGAVGGLLGSVLGFVFAQAVSSNVFNSTITLMPWLVPVTIISSVVVTGLACLIPIRSATDVDPALVLKGE